MLSAPGKSKALPFSKQHKSSDSAADVELGLAKAMDGVAISGSGSGSGADPLTQFKPPAARYPGAGATGSGGASANSKSSAVGGSELAVDLTSFLPAKKPAATASAAAAPHDEHDPNNMSLTIDADAIRTQLEAPHRKLLQVLRGRLANLNILRMLE